MKALLSILLCTSVSIFAEPISFRWTTTGNGSFGGQVFTNSRVTLAVFADTATGTEMSISGLGFVVVEGVGSAHYLEELTVSRNSHWYWLTVDGLLRIDRDSFRSYNLQTNLPLTFYSGNTFSSGAARETTVGMVSFVQGNSVGLEGRLEPQVGPSISSGAQQITVIEGESPVLSVSVAGTRPFDYQWRKNGVDYAFKRMPLTIMNAYTNDSGEYEVEVTNAFGDALSEKITLTVNPSKPVVTANPVSQGAILGSNLVLEAKAVGTSPITWQWYFQDQPLPGQISGRLTLSNVTPAMLGVYHAVGFNAHGSAETERATIDRSYIIPWGRAPGALPFASSNIIAMTAGDEQFLALHSDGTVSASGGGDRGENIVPAGLSNVVSIAAGSTHSLVSLESGRTAIWGSFFQSQKKDIAPEAQIDVAMVGMGMGSQHAAALKYDGTVVPFGGPYATMFAVPEGATNIVSLAVGAYHTLALRADGRVFSWGGQPLFPATNVPASATGVVAVAAGWGQSVALRADGKVIQWAPTTTFSGSNFVDIACMAYGTLGLRSNGQVVSIGDTSEGLAQVPAATTNAAAVAAGPFTGFALMGHGKPVFNAVAMDRRVDVGSNAYFRMRAVGAQPISYQWKFNGVELEGQTNSWLVVTNVQAEDIGIYAVTATNSEGSATSRGMGLNLARVEVFSAGPSGNGFTIGVRTTAGIRYALEFKDDLDESEWSLLEERRADSESISFSDSMVGAQRYYRVRRL